MLEKGEFTQAIATAAEGLRHAPYSIDLLVVLASAYRESGDLAKADETRARWMGLVDSILRSGDGRSYKTAFHVISINEEYAVLRMLRLQPGNQSLQEHGASQYDVMQVQVPSSDKPVELFFNIDLPKQWLDRQFAKTK